MEVFFHSCLIGNGIIYKYMFPQLNSDYRLENKTLYEISPQIIKYEDRLKIDKKDEKENSLSLKNASNVDFWFSMEDRENGGYSRPTISVTQVTCGRQRVNNNDESNPCMSI